jgi:hypothetical protein
VTTADPPSAVEAPIPITIHAGAAAAGAAAVAVSSGHIPRVLELVQFLSVFCSSLSSRQQDRVSVFQIASLTGFALSKSNACQICPSRCMDPSVMVEPTFALICILAAITSMFIGFDAFKARKSPLSANRDRIVPPDDGDASKAVPASMPRRIVSIGMRCSRLLIEMATSYVLMPATFVCVLNIGPVTFAKADASKRFMTISTLAIAPVLRTIVIHKRFVNMTSADQKQLHVTSVCSCFISVVLGVFFVQNRQMYQPGASFASDTPAQFTVLAFLMLQLAVHSVIRLRASQASVLDNINMPWRNAAGQGAAENISFDELRVRLVKSSVRNLFASSVTTAANFVLMNYLSLSQIMMVLAGLTSSSETSISRIEAAAIAIGVIPLVNSGLLLLHMALKLALWLWRKAVSRLQKHTAHVPAKPLVVATHSENSLP